MRLCFNRAGVYTPDDPSNEAELSVEHKTDGIWKELLDEFFPDFMDLFFPDAYAGIDWEKGFQLRDKELQKLNPGDKEGLRVVDKLIEVHVRGGSRMLVMVHIEIQSQHDPEFESRMFTYHYKTLARYKLPVASFAVLADPDPLWRPAFFEGGVLGTRIRLDYSVVKLLDFRARWDELSESSNRFAILVQAFLKVMETRQNLEERGRWKLEVLKGLYKKAYPEEDFYRVYRFFEWIVRLPPKLQEKVRLELYTTDDENVMTFIPDIEQIGIDKGRLSSARESVLEALEVRFGAVPKPVKEAVEAVPDPKTCKRLLQKAIQTESVEAFEEQLKQIREYES